MTTKTNATTELNIHMINPLIEPSWCVNDTIDSVTKCLRYIADLENENGSDINLAEHKEGRSYILRTLAAALDMLSYPDAVGNGKVTVPGVESNLPLDAARPCPTGPGPDFRLDVTGVHTDLTPEEARMAGAWAELSPAGRATILDEIRVLAAAEAAVAD